MISLSTPASDSVADIEIFSKDVEKYRDLLRKKGGDCDLGDGGQHMVDYADSWGARFHKGYQGLLELVRLIYTRKKSHRSYLLLTM